MKSKMMLVVACLILICVILPTGAASADDKEAWVLVETYFSPPEKNRAWEQTFLDVVTFNKIILTETEFSYRQKVEKAGNTTVDASFQFSFDTPPEELVPGETVRLSITGLSSGKGDVTEKTFGLNVKEWIDDPPNNQTYTQLGRKVTGVIKASVAEVRTKLEGTATEDKQILEFIVPEIIDGKLIITTSNNITADVGISWTYEPRESNSSPEGSDPSDDLPDWVKQGQMYVDEYGQAIYVPDWLEWMKPPERKIKNRGIVQPWGGGELWVYDKAFEKWRGPIRSDTTLRSGDIVRTGPDSQCRIWFTNDEGKQEVISVGRDTLLEVPSDREESKWPTLWAIYEGAVSIKRAVLREAPVQVEPPPPFAIRTPTTVVATGTRREKPPTVINETMYIPNFTESTKSNRVLKVGTAVQYYLPKEYPPLLLAVSFPFFWFNEESKIALADEWEETGHFIVTHDQETKTSAIFVISGELNYYNMAAAGPDDTVMTAGQKLLVTKDGTETVITFTNPELDSLMANYELEQPVLRSRDELEALFNEVEKGAASSFQVQGIIGIVAVVIIIAFFVIRKRLKKA